MVIPLKKWAEYIRRMALIDKTAAAKMTAYLNKNGLPETYEASKKLIEYGNSLVMKYGEASSSLACEMYDAISIAEMASVPAAVPAALPTYGDVAKAINGTLKLGNTEIIAGAVERLVKMPGADTMLENAIRDKAEWAWIPSGDTCMFCLTLASNGWQTASPSQLDGGHAEHIHAHCDCTFAIRHNTKTRVGGYDPEKYKRMYDDAPGRSSQDKINAMRREAYAENKEKINEQKRSAYEKRKELNSSEAEETNVN